MNEKDSLEWWASGVARMSHRQGQVLSSTEFVPLMTLCAMMDSLEAGERRYIGGNAPGGGIWEHYGEKMGWPESRIEACKNAETVYFVVAGKPPGPSVFQEDLEKAAYLATRLDGTYHHRWILKLLADPKTSKYAAEALTSTKVETPLLDYWSERSGRRDPRDKARARELREKGMSFRAIGECFGVSHVTIQGWLKESQA